MITREQRKALAKAWQREPQGTYRAFRKAVQRTIGCDGAIVVPWCGMWLCIERDGYTHT